MVLDDPGMSSYDELADWLTARVARTLNVSPDAIDVDTPLADYGIDSAASLALCADLEAEKGIAVETTIVWDYATIGAIAAYLVSAELSS
jgi:acyl carrier protein